MQLAIIILAHIWFFDGFVDSIELKNNNLLFSSTLITLLAWQENIAWGITTLCVTVLITLIFLIRANK